MPAVVFLRILHGTYSSSRRKWPKSNYHLSVSKGISVEHPDAEGRTPLHYEAGSGRNSTIEPLLEEGAMASTHQRDILMAALLFMRQPDTAMNRVLNYY
jgi:hypothetical protein